MSTHRSLLHQLHADRKSTMPAARKPARGPADQPKSGLGPPQEADFQELTSPRGRNRSSDPPTGQKRAIGPARKPTNALLDGGE